jgi:hypothetical protein
MFEEAGAFLRAGRLSKPSGPAGDNGRHGRVGGSSQAAGAGWGKRITDLAFTP